MTAKDKVTFTNDTLEVLISANSTASFEMTLSREVSDKWIEIGNATVTICHTITQNLASICRQADILITACGVPGLITSEHITDKSIVIDVGLSFVDGKTCGDVSPDVYDICQAVTPVPRGVGPVTCVTLLQNLIKAHNNTK